MINGATAVVMPSRWKEAFGNVAVEAMQMSRPIVATRVGGLPEIVEDCVTGYLVDSEDAGKLAQAISRLLSDPVRAWRMGKAGRARALDLFSFRRHVEAHEALHLKLVQDQR